MIVRTGVGGDWRRRRNRREVFASVLALDHKSIDDYIDLNLNYELIWNGLSGYNSPHIGLCVRYEPPIIGVHYKNKASDSKKKVYTILLQKLVLHPYPDEAADQLFREHPHILKEEKVSKKKVASLIAKIQQELGIGE